MAVLGLLERRSFCLCEVPTVESKACLRCGSFLLSVANMSLWMVMSSGPLLLLSTRGQRLQRRGASGPSAAQTTLPGQKKRAHTRKHRPHVFLEDDGSPLSFQV